MRLDPYCSDATQLVVIADTNALLSSVLHDHRTGRRSRLRMMTAFGTSALFAPDHVYHEVYEHLPAFSAGKGIPQAELRARFDSDYLPILRFVTVPEEQIADPQVLQITDPDDVPTGQLAKLISPCVVFSDDKHLQNPGFAPRNWPNVAGHAVDLAKGVAKQNAAGGLAVAPGWGAIALVKFIGRQLGISPWLVGAFFTAGATLLLSDPDRRTRFGQILEQYGVPILTGLSVVMEDAQIQQEIGINGLRKVALAAPSEPSVKQQVAIVLSRQSEPLLASEIHNLITGCFPVDTVPTVTEVRAALSGNPEFVRYRRYRWEFGRYAAPQPGSS